jgi:hypothetical protein
MKACKGCTSGLRFYRNARKGLIGQQFLYLRIIDVFRESDSFNNFKVLCQCDCGGLKQTRYRALKDKDCISCGCIGRGTYSQTGEDNANWDPKLTDEDRGRNIVKYKSFILKVYRRDKYRCRRCKSIGKKLNAHHLDGWNWCKEKRYDINNVITLCYDCHKDFHDEYGRGNNTSKQFLEFCEEL